MVTEERVETLFLSFLRYFSLTGKSTVDRINLKMNKTAIK